MNRATVRSFLDRMFQTRLSGNWPGQPSKPFTGQMYAMIYTRDSEERGPFQIPRRVYKERPGVCAICIDFRKLEKFIAYKRERTRPTILRCCFWEFKMSHMPL